MSAGSGFYPLYSNPLSGESAACWRLSAERLRKRGPGVQMAYGRRYFPSFLQAFTTNDLAQYWRRLESGFFHTRLSLSLLRRGPLTIDEMIGMAPADPWEAAQGAMKVILTRGGEE